MGNTNKGISLFSIFYCPDCVDAILRHLKWIIIKVLRHQVKADALKEESARLYSSTIESTPRTWSINGSFTEVRIHQVFLKNVAAFPSDRLWPTFVISWLDKTQRTITWKHFRYRDNAKIYRLSDEIPTVEIDFIILQEFPPFINHLSLINEVALVMPSIIQMSNSNSINLLHCKWQPQSSTS